MSKTSRAGRAGRCIMQAVALACAATLLAGCVAPYAFVQPNAVGSGGYYTSDGVYAAPGYYSSYGPAYYDATPDYPGGYGYYGYGPSIGLSLGYSSGWGGYPGYGYYGSRTARHVGCYYGHCGGYSHGYHGRGNWHGGHGSWSHGGGYGHGSNGHGSWSHHGGGSWSTTGGHADPGRGHRGPAPARIVRPPSGSQHFPAPVSTGQFDRPTTQIIRTQRAPAVRPMRVSPRDPKARTH